MNFRHLQRAILAAGAIWLTAGTLQAEPPAAEDLMAFADHLYQQADYYRAITEYERVVFHHPRHALAPTARYQIGRCYFRGGKWEAAVDAFQRLTEEYRGEAIGQRAAFALAHTFYAERKYARAATLLAPLAEQRDPSDARDRAILITGLCRLRESDRSDAVRWFDRVATNSPAKPRAEQWTRAARAAEGIPDKSPWLAGGLSAVAPGAGQLYTGRARDAAIALGINALMGWATYEAFDNGEYVTGTAFALVGSGFYAGNIYHAINGAHKYNRREQDGFFEQWEIQLEPFGAQAGVPHGLALRLALTF